MGKLFIFNSKLAGARPEVWLALGIVSSIVASFIYDYIKTNYL